MANKTSKSNEGYFAKYKTQGLYAKHRKLKLERTVKAQPNNAQVVAAMNDIGSYRRKTPTTPKWTHTSIAEVMMLKAFKKANKPIPVTDRKISEFSIRARAHDSKGNLVFA
jgi:hypothetical protein